MCKNVLKWQTFKLPAWITGKRLKIDGYMLRSVWQALNPLSIHVTAVNSFAQGIWAAHYMARRLPVAISAVVHSAFFAMLLPIWSEWWITSINNLGSFCSLSFVSHCVVTDCRLTALLRVHWEPGCQLRESTSLISNSHTIFHVVTSFCHRLPSFSFQKARSSMSASSSVKNWPARQST